MAVSQAWWTVANPNNDPRCSGVSVQLTFNGQTIILPVVDMCTACDATHIQVSQAVFQQFAPSQPSGCAAPWDAGTSYVPGDVVSDNGHNWNSMWWSTGAEPGAPISWDV